MDNCVKVKTVFGIKEIPKTTVTLSHEHICCYSESLKMMSNDYIDKKTLAEKAAEILKAMKKKYNLGLFIDCTPVNIGRDIELMKKVSDLSEVNIVCSTGFYYNDEPILDCMSAETLAEFMIKDARNTCAGVIKAAVEYDTLSDFNKKLLKAAAITHRKTGLPIVLHTNANNQNGLKATEILLCENVAPQKIAVGHLSDTDNDKYIKNFAEIGCYVAFDRMYDDTSDDYINKKINQIENLCYAGYSDHLLLSHDDAVFMGFCENPHIQNPRWNYIFDHISPRLDSEISEKILAQNPTAMLAITD